MIATGKSVSYLRVTVVPVDIHRSHSPWGTFAVGPSIIVDHGDHNSSVPRLIYYIFHVRPIGECNAIYPIGVFIFGLIQNDYRISAFSLRETLQEHTWSAVCDLGLGDDAGNGGSISRSHEHDLLERMVGITHRSVAFR